MEAERRRMVRQARQLLETLAGSGLDRVPKIQESALSAPRLERRLIIAPAPEDVPTAAKPTPLEERERPEPIVARSPAPAPAPAPTPPNATPNLFDVPGFDEAVVPASERPARLTVIAEEVAGCTRCPVLVQNRTQTVFGEGNPNARLMFIGEGPGQTEDETGRPFVGRAGQLLNDMITKGMGLRREDVYIANIIKCRPPENRDPQPEEARNCLGYLERQIAIVRPEFLCLLGKPAAQTLLQTALPMGRLRSRWFRYKDIPTIATWHPAYLMRRGASAKREAWEDLKMLMQAMGLIIPEPKKKPDA